MLVYVDTTRSISDEMLQTFITEVKSIMNMYGEPNPTCEIYTYKAKRPAYSTRHRFNKWRKRANAAFNRGDFSLQARCLDRARKYSDKMILRDDYY